MDMDVISTREFHRLTCRRFTDRQPVDSGLLQFLSGPPIAIDVDVYGRGKSFKAIIKAVVAVIVKDTSYARNHAALPCPAFDHATIDMAELVAESEIPSIAVFLEHREVFEFLIGIFVLMRSEEHTSELQSRLHLVCRLLLEKKKTTAISHITHSI